MSVETRGRQAAEGLRSTVTVDLEQGLSQLRRTRRRRDAGRVVAASVVLAGLVGGSLIVRDSDDRIPPVEPPVRNGIIIHTGEGTSPPSTSPELDAVSPYPTWVAFDQDTESFLFVAQTDDQVFVVGQDGPIAEFDCPPAACGLIETFGPGPDELTEFVEADDQWSALIVGYDSKVRDTIDLANIGDGQNFAGLAWSPEGDRLAVATEPDHDCNPGAEPCEAMAWILDRDGGKPQLVHAEGMNPGLPMITGLAWSPDGRSLALTLSSDAWANAADKGVWPRLVALRFQPGEPVHADTLHVYDDYDWRAESSDAVLSYNNDRHFAFGWSPDGTRIAVSSEGGVAEISSADGQVLARHPGEFVHGPLAWLRER